jgi:hypothetical protein
MKPIVDLRTHLDATICGTLKAETMDPIGYFLIRIYKGGIEVGLCNYSEINIIKRLWVGEKPQNIYRRIIRDLPKIRKDHCAYLGKELARAWICLKTDTKYIQDGKVDGTFPEVDLWKR